jgi:hypothetical protein
MAKRYKVLPHQVGTSDYFKDIAVKAKLPGRRVSRKRAGGSGGKIYYEYRANRSDMYPGARL